MGANMAKVNDPGLAMIMRYILKVYIKGKLLKYLVLAFFATPGQ
jgi:hypothetical protein